MSRELLVAILLLCAALADEISSASDETSTGTGTVEADENDDSEGDLAPFMIVVEHSDGWRCSGSLVSLRTALTSARCARGRLPSPRPRPSLARPLIALAAGAAPLASASGPASAASRIDAVRRISRVVLATGADAEDVESENVSGELTWRGAEADLALVELERPFGAEAHVRPIVIATKSEECTTSEEDECQLARIVPSSSSRPVRVRNVEAELVAPDVCASAARHWSALDNRTLCLVGAELCPSDRGAGVVCGGRLCGVVSRSVGGRAGCGRTHAAHGLARWRRFLHCAQTTAACRSGGDCADLCVEQRLSEDSGEDFVTLEDHARPTIGPSLPTFSVDDVPIVSPPSSEAIRYPESPRAAEVPTHAEEEASTLPLESVESLEAGERSNSRGPTLTPARASPAAPAAPARTGFVAPARSIPVAPARTVAAAPTRRAPAPPAPPAAAAAAPTRRVPAIPVAPVVHLDAGPQISSRPSFEFEPNRVDFKAPSRSTPVYLKAGEYGDNAAEAEYGGEEALPPTPSAPTASAQLAPPAPAALAGAGTPAPATIRPTPEHAPRAAASHTIPTTNAACYVPTVLPIFYYLPFCWSLFV